jgi:hypothetical protein
MTIFKGGRAEMLSRPVIFAKIHSKFKKSFANPLVKTAFLVYNSR